MSKLTVKKIEHTPIKDKEYRMPDGSGLFLRVRKSGAKSWLFCFRLSGNRALLQMTLGSTSDLSLKDARAMLPDLRKLVSQGIDPRTARAASIAENAQAITMQALLDAWIDFIQVTDLMSPAWIKRHQDRWRLHLKQPLGKLLVKDITRAHLSAALDAMTRKGIKEETRKALTTLNLMLDYGLTRHSIEHNPSRMLKPKDFAASANKPRDRVLFLPEIRKVWHALDQAQTTDTTSTGLVTTTAIKILILTGARRGEVASMRWDEVNIDFDLENGVWNIPANKTKNGKEHRIYFGKLAIELITNLESRNLGSDYVFDSGRKSKNGHIHQDTITDAVGQISKGLSKERSIKTFKHFSAHDLRRSASTAWGEYLKVSPHIIERMLNHQPRNKLIATYQHATYIEEQKNAWLSWNDFIQNQIINERNNIIPIRSAINS